MGDPRPANYFEQTPPAEVKKAEADRNDLEREVRKLMAEWAQLKRKRWTGGSEPKRTPENTLSDSSTPKWNLDQFATF